MQLTGHVIIQLSKCSQNSLTLQIADLSARQRVPGLRLRAARQGLAAPGCAPPAPPGSLRGTTAKISLLPRACPALAVQPSPGPARGPSLYLVLQIKIERGPRVAAWSGMCASACLLTANDQQRQQRR